MKPLFNKDELKAKGFDRHKVESKIPIELDEVEQRENPFKLEFSWGDRFNQFGMWLQGFVINAAGEIIKRAIPPWVWLALIAAVVVVLLVVL